MATRWTADRHLLVAAIDFGTTYSGWAFSSTDDFNKDPNKIKVQGWNFRRLQSAKAPTNILIKPDGETFDSFGYEAEDKYSTLTSDGKNDEWYFFRHFKMMLDDQELCRDTELEDVLGKKKKAIDVFAMCIRFLKDDMFKICTDRVSDIRESDIRWVLTVPAIWNDAAKQFMREAAKIGGIDTDDLYIALEPECASICCRHIKATREQSVNEFPAGTKYIVVDAGGGTVDVVTHQIEGDGKLKECSKPSGGGFGGTLVNEAFMTFMKKYFGDDKIHSLKEEEMEDYVDLSNSFESAKRNFKGNKDATVTIKIPLCLVGIKLAETDVQVKDGSVKVQKDKLRISGAVFATFFNESVQKTIDHVQRLFKDKNVGDCTYILLVGGFAESELLQAELRSAFHDKTVIIPEDAGLAVLKGAVMYGHKTSIISQRVCRYTYGIDSSHIYDSSCYHPKGRREVDKNGDMRCHNMFDIHVRAGDTVVFGQEQEKRLYGTLYDTQTTVCMSIYRCPKVDPILITETGCEKIGQFTITLEKPGDDTFTASMMFGGTEIEVKCVELSNGKITKAKTNFLE